MLLIFIAASGLALVGVAQVWTTLTKREKEKDLLFALGQFRQALDSYARVTTGPQQPAAVPQAATQGLSPQALPQQLDDLLLDPRAPNVQRHLRQIYVDPMTGKADWVLVMRQGRIAGIHSRSEAAPLGKKYILAGINFEAASKYSDWKVVYTPTQAGAGAGVPAAAAGAGVPPAPGFPGDTTAAAGAALPTSAPPARVPVPPAPPPRERPTTTDRDLTVMNERELNQYCTQLNLLDVQACSASKSLTPLGKMECMKSASARQGACMLRQNTLPPLYLADR